MIHQCPICERESQGIERKRGWFTHFLCGECQTAVLISSEGEPAYPDDYFGEGDAKFSGMAGAARKRWHSGRARVVAEVGQAASSRSIYDIGCGDGAFLSACKREGFEVAGCEPQERAREQARKNLGCRIDGDLFSEAPVNSLDIVTAWQVIEHVENPGEMIRKIHDYLKPGGLFAVSTVNLSSWQARIFGSLCLHLDPPRHLWVGHRSQVEHLLERNGFTIERRRWNHLEFGPIGYVDSLVNVFDHKRDRILKCLKTGFPGIPNKISWLAAAVITPPALILSTVEACFSASATFELYARRRNS